MPKWLRNTLLVLAALVVVFGIAIFIYSRPLTAQATALEALKGSPTVTVENTDQYILFTPKTATTRGLIFYQGAKVAAEAYSASLIQIAGAGFKVWAVKFPLNFAVLNSNAAQGIIDAHPEITDWGIAGHSLGGAMACSYAKTDPRVGVLIFWAAYCDKSFDLSGNKDIRVVSISGSLDGLATPEKVAATKQYAPANTKYVIIPGMNHAEFGDYGPQSGDNPATLETSVATQKVVAATLEALQSLRR
jgi:pimeloyl-ACP methyl ester carboxylesterase